MLTVAILLLVAKPVMACCVAGDWGNDVALIVEPVEVVAPCHGASAAIADTGSESNICCSECLEACDELLLDTQATVDHSLTIKPNADTPFVKTSPPARLPIERRGQSPPSRALYATTLSNATPITLKQRLLI